MFIGEILRTGGIMAKSDSFFIRATQNIQDDNDFYEGSIDLGAYVDALGKSVLRIHNIAVSFTDESGRSPDVKATGTTSAQFQLTTQSNSNIVLGTNKSVIASGQINAYRLPGTAGVASAISHDLDNLPQLWTNGYLVAVDAIYLGGSAIDQWNEDVYVTVTMECTVESMSQAAAMALALSQQ